MAAAFKLAIIAGKLSAWAIRTVGLGLGSNLPGRLARMLAPGVLAKLTGQVRYGVIAVSGTNGKSTTSGFIYSILRRAGFKTIHNRQGANLVTGITASIVEAATLDGKLDADYCLFEIDEASLPVVASEIELSVVVITNLFRDQLDRFGELDTTAGLLNRGILRHQSPSILNADDPNVAQLAANSNRIYYGIDSFAPGFQHKDMFGTVELAYCPNCGAEYQYSQVFYGQLGHYHCQSCKMTRPEPTISAANVLVESASSSFDLKMADQSYKVELPLPGLFNIYNALAAAALASCLGIAGVTVVEGLKKYKTLFGRSEQIKINGRNVLIQLIKNPVGASQVLSSASADATARLLIAINDNLADGRDISWLWDADFELLHKHKTQIIVSGQRAYDMAVRLKYAGISNELIEVVPKLDKALEEILTGADAEQTIWILPTYTCLLELQKILKAKGYKLAGT